MPSSTTGPFSARSARLAAAQLAVGDTGGVHQGVGHGLIHADRAAQHAAAHIGDAGQLKQALDRAVLAVFAVHDGGADVNVDQLRLAVLQQPDDRGPGGPG